MPADIEKLTPRQQRLIKGLLTGAAIRQSRDSILGNPEICNDLLTMLLEGTKGPVPIGHQLQELKELQMARSQIGVME